MYVVGKTWCHNELDDTTEKKEYDTYEDAKAAYDNLIKCEQNNFKLYGYTRTERFTCPDFRPGYKDENTIFTTDFNYHIDRNENNFCDVFLFYKEW